MTRAFQVLLPYLWVPHLLLPMSVTFCERPRPTCACPSRSWGHIPRLPSRAAFMATSAAVTTGVKCVSWEESPGPGASLPDLWTPRGEVQGREQALHGMSRLLPFYLKQMGRGSSMAPYVQAGGGGGRPRELPRSGARGVLLGPTGCRNPLILPRGPDVRCNSPGNHDTCDEP